MLISIDPSQNSLGLALHTSIGALVDALHIKRAVPIKQDWHKSAMQMAHAVGQAVRVSKAESRLFQVLIELPANWASARGQDSKNSGSIQQLYFTCGAICTAMQQFTSCTGVWGVAPNTWKGQASKDKMIRRALIYAAKHDIDLTGAADDVAEAVLLGRYAFVHGISDRDGLIGFRSPIVHVTDNQIVKDLSMFDYIYFS